MATHVGIEAVLLVGSTPAAVGGILSWQLEEEAEDNPDTGLNDEWETRLSAGSLRKRWNGRLRYKIDTAGAEQSTLALGALVSGEFYPTGNVSSREFKSGDFVINRKTTEASEDNGIMVYEIEFNGTGELTTGTVA